MTKKSLLGKRAVYVAMMDIRMDIVVTRAAYRRPHDNLLWNVTQCGHTHNERQTYTEGSYRLSSYNPNKTQAFETTVTESLIPLTHQKAVS